MQQLWKDAGFLALIVATLTLGLGFMLSRLDTSIGLPKISLALVASIVMITAIAYVALKVVGSVVQRQLDDLTPQMVAMTSSFEHLRSTLDRDWLISREELIQFEAKANVDEIWILSRTLEEETNADTFLPLVEDNVRRGIRYRYIVPENDETRAKREQILSAHKRRDRVLVKFVANEIFDLVAAQDIAIYGPTGKGATGMQGFMNVPIEGGGAGLYIRLGTSHVQRLVGRLIKLGVAKN